ncbi:MAG TPA: DUF4388 domain-containing protein [Thermodesulfobacteriota bacterium]|nr:DUF4388 domain-containing protein [Thermodesulfobacteriota bacterium]
MPETFLGDLAEAKLFDILKPLFSDKKTGKVILKGKEGGELYLELGNITHAKTGNSVGEYAFFTLMGLKDGKAAFEPDELPSERTISISTEQLILNWSSQKQWNKIKEVVPSANAIFRILPQKNPESISLTGEQWNVSALCNGTKTVSEIGEALKWDEFKTSKTIFQLVQLGLLERAEDRKPIKKKLISNGFFATVETELKKVIGPMAPFVISDKLSDMGASRDSFPQDQVSSFVQTLSEEISDNFMKKEFLRAMTDYLLTDKRVN